MSESSRMIRKELLRSLHCFAYMLYDAALLNRDLENVLVAPFSVFTALLAILCGARGETAAEMKRAMGLTDLQAGDIETSLIQLGQECRDILKTNFKSQGNHLEVIIKLWLQNELDIDNSFIKALEAFHDMEICRVDFINDSQSAYKEINTRISKFSRNEISDLANEDYTLDQMRFLIVNGLYFKGEWQLPFDSSKTEPHNFFVLSSSGGEKPKQVDMMYKQANFGLINLHDYECHMLILKYCDSSFRMLIILPNKHDGIHKLEEKIRSDGFDYIHECLDGAEEEEVKVYLPKFKISSRRDLLTSLKHLGINKLFTENANLSGICQGDAHHINGFCHQVCIDVGEEGTEIVTVGGGKKIVAAGSEPSEFKADHPFLFCIYDQDTDVIVVLGRLCNPPSN